MVKNNIFDYLAIILSLASLLIAGVTLFLSVLKWGKPVISIVESNYRVTAREVIADEATGLSKSYSGNIEFTVFIRNSGAKETAYSQIAWSVNDDFDSFNIVVSDNRTCEEMISINILKPYEQNINVITVGIFMKYRDIDQIKKDRIIINCEYNWLRENNMKKIKKKFDLTDVLIGDFLKYPA